MFTSTVTYATPLMTRSSKPVPASELEAVVLSDMLVATEVTVAALIRPERMLIEWTVALLAATASGGADASAVLVTRTPVVSSGGALIEATVSFSPGGRETSAMGPMEARGSMVAAAP
jgi:hypothetical protein